MKHILFFFYIFSFLSGIAAFLNLFLIYIKTRSINLRNYLFVFGFFYIMSILSAVYIYLDTNIHSKSFIIIKSLFTLNFISQSIFIFYIFESIIGIFKIPFTKLRRVMLVVLSFSPITYFFGVLVYASSFETFMKMIDIWSIIFSLLLFLLLLSFAIRYKKYFSRIEEEETKKIVKIGFFLYFIFLTTHIIITPLSYFGCTVSFFSDAYFGLFVITHSSYCIYFSIRYYMNKMTLNSSEAITDYFLQKYLITPREKEVIEKLMLGFSNKDIAASMDITEGTVKVFVYNIYQKVGVKNRMSLAHIAKSGSPT